MNSDLSQSRLHSRPKSNLGRKSPTPQKFIKGLKGMTPSRNSLTGKSTPNRVVRPRSVNQSYDFALDTSKMFHQADCTKSKFFPSAVPSPTFDVHICREEISRLESQLNHSQMLETRIMRNDWRSAQKSMDIQALMEIQNHNKMNLKHDQDFRAIKEDKRKGQAVEERKWKEEEFRAFKAVKLEQEQEQKKKVYDDLLREKNKFLHSQECGEQKKNKVKSENNEKRNSFKAYIRAVREKETNEKVREIKEREFEYAQYLGAKWLHLKQKDQEVKENISILSRLVN